MESNILKIRANISVTLKGDSATCKRWQKKYLNGTTVNLSFLGLGWARFLITGIQMGCPYTGNHIIAVVELAMVEEANHSKA